jgi:hypothetical protein
MEVLEAYMAQGDFIPAATLNEQQLRDLAKGKTKNIGANTNLAFNINDKTAVRKGRKQ